MKEYKITIFTPTYNRAHTLTRLYNSLLNQSFKDFEWLIVDDGSTDNTKPLIESFINENKINIRYYKQENGGKHRAINKGVLLANGELFFIVDSDDYLVDNALEIIQNEYKLIQTDNEFAGVSGRRIYPDEKLIGNEMKTSPIDANALDIRIKYRITGDMAEVYKTDVLKRYPFPDFPGEKFCAESLVWNRIAQKYKFRYTNHKFYVCEYLPGGLSNAFNINRIKSPSYATTLYKELYCYDIPLIHKMKAGINYWRFAFYTKESFYKLLKNIGFSSIFLLPFGLLFKIKDNITLK